MKKFLIVEDNQERIKWFEECFKDHTLHIATSAEQGIEFLKVATYDAIFLDHDLGFDPVTKEKTERVYLASGVGTGYEVAQFIYQHASDTRVIVHSWNPGGARNIIDLLRNQAVWLLFGTPDFKCVAEQVKTHSRI
jgi:CheY-like chemotaxis protein